ncbi:DUF6197 family protein [Micromonospora sp. CPCC 206061]|uniref:DUF6197 family protein n=1 Tax=Micromonospora sp. CPCC 206061 TaxID=3122410 RepID=UPI002FF18A13
MTTSATALAAYKASTVPDVLRNAARYLADHGWLRNHLYDDYTNPTPRACALGAILIAAYGQLAVTPFEDTNHYGEAEVDRYRKARSALEKHLGGRIYIGDWNDAIWDDNAGQTAAHVITVLNNTADTYESAVQKGR